MHKPGAPPILYARDIPWTDVGRLAERGAIALLPIGSTEAHGPHLPLGVDVVIAEEVCRRLHARLAVRGIPALIFPAISYSLTEFAAEFAGTVTVSAESARAFFSDVMEGIASHGFSRIGIVNHHLEPSHFRVVREAIASASARTGATLIMPDHRKPPIAAQLGPEFTHGGSHAGLYETSLMLAAAPHLVDESVRRTLPDLPVDLPGVIKAGARNFRECGGPQAYFGSPSAATPEEGNRLLDLLAEHAEQAILRAQP